MTARNFAQLGAAIFTIVALLHIARLFYGWPVTIGTLSIPLWASWVGVAVAALLAWLGFKASRG
jgi:hypothetical protein